MQSMDEFEKDFTKKYILKVVPKMIGEIKEHLESDEPKRQKDILRNLRTIDQMGELIKAVESFPNTPRKWKAIEKQFNNWECIFYG